MIFFEINQLYFRKYIFSFFYNQYSTYLCSGSNMLDIYDLSQLTEYHFRITYSSCIKI
ncbi:hypothetical protein D3C71_579820 [compost metagenome]